jgi:hypothetical protein
MIVLYFVTNPNARLILVICFILIFALGPSVSTSANHDAIFAATAAYSAVLVVFVSGDLANTKWDSEEAEAETQTGEGSPTWLLNTFHSSKTVLRIINKVKEMSERFSCSPLIRSVKSGNSQWRKPERRAFYSRHQALSPLSKERRQRQDEFQSTNAPFLPIL